MLFGCCCCLSKTVEVCLAVLKSERGSFQFSVFLKEIVIKVISESKKGCFELCFVVSWSYRTAKRTGGGEKKRKDV